MSNAKQRQPWERFRERALADAKQLEKQAALNRVVAMADDPLDAFMTVWDLAALQQHRALARNAQLHGRQLPMPPAPVSRLLSGFMESMGEKVAAIAAQLDVEARRRVLGVMPGFLRAIELEDPDVVVLVTDLLPRSPDVVVEWIEHNIDAIERRFAS